MHRTSRFIIAAVCILWVALTPDLSAQYFFVPKPTNAVYFSGGHIDGNSMSGVGMEGGIVFKGGFDIGVSVDWSDIDRTVVTTDERYISLFVREYFVKASLTKTVQLILYGEQGMIFQSTYKMTGKGYKHLNDEDLFFGGGTGVRIGQSVFSIFLTGSYFRYGRDVYDEGADLFGVDIHDRVALGEEVWFITGVEADYLDKRTSISLTARFMYGLGS